MKEEISKEDKQFLDDFFADELTEERLLLLDEKLKHPKFKKIYQQRLDSQYKIPPLKLIVSYLPLILLILLTLLGIYLINNN